MFGYFRNSSNPNTLVGIFLLVLLAVFAGPGVLPNLLPSIIPGADESIRCDWLRTGDQRATHQSLIGRAVDANAISVKVRTTALPNQPGQSLDISIVITNRSIGTVAIYYNHDQVRIGDDGISSGLGIVFNSANSQAFSPGANTTYPEEDIRLLGPRQSCVHHAVFAYEQIPQLGIGVGNYQVKAYYRSTARGISQATAGAIYTDQGLWVGLAQSDSVAIPLSGG